MTTTKDSWLVKMGNILLTGGDETIAVDGQPFDEQGFDTFGFGSDGPNISAIGVLTAPPDGIGMPDVNNTDVVYPMRDGMTPYVDTYSPRVVTLSVVVADGAPVGAEGNVRTRVGEIVAAFQRINDMTTEMAILPPVGVCPGDDPVHVGCIGRPRSAQASYQQVQDQMVATMTLRFDCVDHRLYLLDEDGDPGSGVLTATATTSAGATITNDGQIPALLTLTVTGACTNPAVTIATEPAGTPSGTVTWNGTLGSSDTLVIDLTAGTATLNSTDATYLLSGTYLLQASVGDSDLTITADSGTPSVTATWREAVLSV